MDWEEVRQQQSGCRHMALCRAKRVMTLRACAEHLLDSRACPTRTSQARRIREKSSYPPCQVERPSPTPWCRHPITSNLHSVGLITLDASIHSHPMLFAWAVLCNDHFCFSMHLQWDSVHTFSSLLTFSMPPNSQYCQTMKRNWLPHHADGIWNSSRLTEH